MSGGRGGKTGSAAGGQSARRGDGQSDPGDPGDPAGSQATYLVIDGNEVIFRSPHIGAAWAFRRGLGEAQATIAKVVGEPGGRPRERGDELREATA